MKGKINLDLKAMYALLINLVFSIFSLVSVVGKFSLPHLFLLLFWGVALIAMIKGHKVINVDMSYFPFIFYVCIQTLLLIHNTEESAPSIFLKVSQWLLFLLTVAVFNADFFDWKLQNKWRRCAIVLFCSYLFLQKIIALIAHVHIPPGISFLPYTRPELLHTYDWLRGTNATYRPRSFFSEPAMFCQVALAMLVVELFSGEKKTLKDYRYAILLILGVIVSMSGTGFAGLCFVAILSFFYFGHRKINKKRMLQLFIGGTIVLLIAVPIILQSAFAEVVLDRFFRNESLFQTLSDEQRFQIFSNLAILELNSPIDYLFGHGFWISEQIGDEFLNGLLRHFYNFGIVGMLLFALILVKNWLRGGYMRRSLILLLLFLCIGANPLHNDNVMLFLAYAAAGSSTDKTKGEICTAGNCGGST